ncbi:Gfo/Idh/MocA family protein [Brevibacillus sp. BC25]|uniref:Gfo/Idh/MocA family protein n=1 Tax=Brevibacillus sp. BC25 TaxID=1144308 RepID=UPI00027146DF|nr:Gfo/Idh/MocA family oxidoreductase [Brevibacillus sp. BC25]EJL30558.1 putative dehydrogenase [Brevibacillus sp. BC25]
MKAIVIGFGSIGMRHARLLDKLECKVAVVSSRIIEWDCHYFSLTEALQIEKPDYVIVANRTSEHYKTLLELSRNGFKGTVLVEKPLFDQENEVPPNDFQNLFVGYNLRFHPGIKKLKSYLENEKILSFHVYTGQYLPQWRPQIDYRTAYSSRKEDGGGVLRDLSHELDYVNWLLGGWERLTALGGQFSSLEINSDDIFSILLQTKKCPVVTININYMDRLAKRFVIVNTENNTIKLDMINNEIVVNDEKETFEVSRDFTYIEQHTAVLNRNMQDLCSLGEASEVMGMIKAVEEANLEQRWIRK